MCRVDEGGCVCIRFVISRLELKGRFFGMGIYV